MRIRRKKVLRMSLFAAALLATVVIVSAATRIHLRSLQDTSGSDQVANSDAQRGGISLSEAPVQKPTRTKLEGELIALRPSGFEPKQINRPAGPFALVVSNESRLSNVTILLKGDVAGLLRNVLVLREKRNWSDVVDLPQGNYQLLEATHPGWVCNITIR